MFKDFFPIKLIEYLTFCLSSYWFYLCVPLFMLMFYMFFSWLVVTSFTPKKKEWYFIITLCVYYDIFFYARDVIQFFVFLVCIMLLLVIFGDNIWLSRHLVQWLWCSLFILLILICLNKLFWLYDAFAETDVLTLWFKLWNNVFYVINITILSLWRY